ncbi:MAG: NAD(P)/FAD-dependent oxidoreductase [Chloroflexota bacterium]
MTTAILGAGALGLTLAYRLVQAGQSVEVFERGSEPGGLAAGFRVGGAYVEKFYHHLFGTDRSAINLIQELGLGDRLLWLRPESSILYHGGMYPMDSVGAVLRFPPLALPNRLRLGAATAYLKVERNYHRLERHTASAWLRRWMGAEPYRVVWEPLLRAKFGVHADDILMSWMWARLHYRTAKLGYVRGGFQLLYERLVGAIQQRHGRLHFGETVRSIVPQSGGGFTLETNARQAVFDVVVSTAPTRLTLQLVPDLPAAFRQQYDQGLAYAAHCVVLELDRQLMRPYWLCINDPGFPFLAVVEHTNLLPPSDYGGKHLVYLGNYLPQDDPVFRQTDEAVVTAFTAALPRLNPAFDPSWVQAAHVFKAPYAQPIVTAGFVERLPPNRTPVPDFYMANMFQIYPQDRGQNYSIALAERVANMVLEDVRSAVRA